MKKSTILAAAALSAGLMSAAPAFAGDKEDVAAVFGRISAALTACDIDKFAAQLDPEGAVYAPDGSPLQSMADNIAYWRQTCADGGRGTLSYTPVRIEVYGDIAVAHGVHMGSFTPPGGETHPTNMRVTGVLMKKGGVWKVHHAHLSPMAPPAEN